MDTLQLRITSLRFWFFLLPLLQLTGLVTGVSPIGRNLEGSDPYKNLIVEVKQEVTNCDVVLKNLEKTLNTASDKLFDATSKLSFPKVTVIIPNNIAADCQKPTDLPIWDSVPDVQHLTVTADHPVFGKNPWTQQTQGCGKPGDSLNLPQSFLTDTTDTDAIKGKYLIREWAKYRWGAFEENGIEDDPVYPLEFSSVTASGGTAYSPSYCSNQPLIGSSKGSCKHPNCGFNFDAKQNATSSLMALPSLETVKTFCDSATHNIYLSNKQNTMCDYQSVMEIYNKHSDASHSLVPVVTEVKIDYVLLNKQATETYVILIDETANMDDSVMKDRWLRLTSAVKQWILEDVLSNSSVALVSFDDVPSSMANMTEVTDQTRGDLVEAIIPAPLGGSLKNVSLALSYLESKLTITEATVILIVEPQLHSKDTAAKMIAAAGSNSIWPILFPMKNTSNDDRTDLQDLATATGGRMQIVDDEHFDNGGTSQQSLRVQRNLVQRMRYVQRKVAYTHRISSTRVLTQVDHLESRNPSYTFQFPVGTNVNLEEPLAMKFYSHKKPNDVWVNGTQIDIVETLPSSYTAFIPQPSRSTYVVNISFPEEIEPHLVEVLALENPNEVIAMFRSSHDLGYVDLNSQTTGPVIVFTEVTKGGLPVVGADVEVIFYNQGKTASLQLIDNGGGPDITGNDGTYSAYWTFVPNGAAITYDIYLKVRSTEETYVIGKEGTDGVKCCGSSMNLENVPKTLIEDTYIDLKVGTSYVNSFAGQLDIYPPSKVNDLRAFVVYQKVNLNFTAPGDDLDRGYAFDYRVWWRQTTETAWIELTTTEYLVTKGGLTATVAFIPPLYDTLLEYSFTARDTRLQESPHSNPVRLTHPGGSPPSIPVVSCPSCLGSVLGAFFGGVAFGVIILVFGYLGSQEFKKQKGKSKERDTEMRPGRPTPRTQSPAPPPPPPMGRVNERYVGDERELYEPTYDSIDESESSEPTYANIDK